MSRPGRTDSPKKIMLSLSAACHEQAADLAHHFQSEPGRRYVVTFSEVVERAVTALHDATAKDRVGRRPA